jgi:replicative DNA helicase Mcm
LVSEFVKDGKSFYLKELTELTPNDEWKDNILLQGIVTGNSEIEHYSTFVVVKCTNCKCEYQYDVADYKDWRDMKPTKKCLSCSNSTIEVQNDKEQLKKILISQQGKTSPLHLVGYVYGENIHAIQPGIKVNLGGIYKSRKIKPSDLTYRPFFDVSRFKLTDEKPMMPTQSEIEMFKNMDKNDLVKSFAPHIKGMELIKEGLLLCCIGGVERDGIRGDINSLLIGDPGCAKTQLLKELTKIIHKSDYISGRSASGAGLFGGVDNMSDGTRIGRPGSVTMCNGGIACLDEMEKMNAQDRVYCHEIMESQKFSLRKIGIDITWEVKVAIIGAANPKQSRWNPALSIKENINLLDSLLSRFGLIFLVRDIPSKENDLALAHHISLVRQGKITAPLETETITKFVNYAKLLTPTESVEAGELLEKWWVDLRSISQKEESVAVDSRTLEDLHRLADAYAKMDLSETVTTDHAKKAIKMLNDSLQTLGMSTPGERNDSIADSFDKQGYIQFVFSEPISEDMAIAKLRRKPQWFKTDDEAKNEIDKLRNKLNKLIESGGVLKWV